MSAAIVVKNNVETPCEASAGIWLPVLMRQSKKESENRMSFLNMRDEDDQGYWSEGKPSTSKQARIDAHRRFVRLNWPLFFAACRRLEGEEPLHPYRASCADAKFSHETIRFKESDVGSISDKALAADALELESLSGDLVLELAEIAKSVLRDGVEITSEK